MSQISLDSSSPLPLTGTRPNTRWSRRAVLGWLLFALLVATGGLAGWSRTSHFGWFARRAAAFAYDVYDPLTRKGGVPMGFALPDSQEQARDTAARLNASFSDYRALVSAIAGDQPNPGRIIFQHELLSDPHTMAFGAAAEPLLVGVDDLFELCRHVRALTEHGIDELPPDRTNPLDYLALAQQKKLLTCRYFAVLYSQCAVVKGYTARVVGLSRTGEAAEHAVAEVYAPEFGKWILIDCDFNVAYRRNEQWLNAAELHAAWMKLKADAAGSGIKLDDYLRDHKAELPCRLGIELVELGPEGAALRASNLYGGSATDLNLEYFEFVLYHTRNDYLSAYYPPAHRKANLQFVLQDRGRTSFPPVCPDGCPVERLDDLYFPVGRTSLAVGEPTDAPLGVTVELGAWTPNFDRFEIRLDRRQWQDHAAPRLKWPLHAGVNTLEARSVNVAGLRGEVACVQIDLQPH